MEVDGAQTVKDKPGEGRDGTAHDEPSGEQSQKTSPLISETPCLLCIGMAGSGKSSLVQRINSYLHQRRLAKNRQEAAQEKPPAEGDDGKDAEEVQPQRSDRSAELPQPRAGNKDERNAGSNDNDDGSPEDDVGGDEDTGTGSVDNSNSDSDSGSDNDSDSGSGSDSDSDSDTDSDGDSDSEGDDKDEFETPCYLINLDPAVYRVPFEANIDVRETVDYKAVMKNYGLGPNGGIVTSLNLFATKFDEVLAIMEKRSATSEYFLFDTPGQIEVFTWSASGAIITETLASSFPTVVLYVIDTPRCLNPVSFMSNMLYACSIMYKTRLPFILLFNKADISGTEFAFEWLRDYDNFRDAIEGETAYIGSMARSMALVLEEFYMNLRAVGVSALTGAGMDELFDAVDEAVKEYMDDFKPEIDAMFKEKQLAKEKAAEKSLEKLQHDIEVGGDVISNPISSSSSSFITIGEDDVGSQTPKTIPTTTPTTTTTNSTSHSDPSASHAKNGKANGDQEEIEVERDSDDVDSDDNDDANNNAS